MTIINKLHGILTTILLFIITITSCKNQKEKVDCRNIEVIMKNPVLIKEIKNYITRNSDDNDKQWVVTAELQNSNDTLLIQLNIIRSLSEIKSLSPCCIGNVGDNLIAIKLYSTTYHCSSNKTFASNFKTKLFDDVHKKVTSEGDSIITMILTHYEIYTMMFYKGRLIRSASKLQG